jgi:uncharacterized repeat protein (TIGR01451 family)
MRVIDADGFGAEPDDVMDLDIDDDDTTLSLNLDLELGEWTGDVPANQGFSEGDGDHEHFDSDAGGEKGRVFFAISVAGAGDADGDGLLDVWETEGLDADGDGTIDVDLPAFGADPMHKDLFIELDWMTGVGCESPLDDSEDCLGRSDIEEVKEAFAAAPIDAGTNASALDAGVDAALNPDGTPGINVWIDTGDLTDANASEDGAGPDTCADGVDNGTDGADEADPDCLVGDDLSGGNELPVVELRAIENDGDLDGVDDYYELKQANFDAARSLVFRYGISAVPPEDIGIRGQGERGGNDFLEFSHTARTIMHETGHNLGLSHGGDEGDDCKPNYVSVMNLFYQRIPQEGSVDGILDFSPPRFPGGRGEAPIDDLEEDSLNEEVVLDPTDPANRFVFSTGAGQTEDQVQSPLDERPNWNQDEDPPFETDVTGNIDNWDYDGSPCLNSATGSRLTGYDDWLHISLQFRQYGNAEDEPQILPEDPDPVEAVGDDLWEAINTTNLSVDIAASDDPVVAGTQLGYTVRVENLGANPATGTVLTLDLPDGLSHASDDAGCTEDADGDLGCDLGELAAGDDLVVNVTVDVAPDLVYDAGGPTSVTAAASVEHFAGPDSEPADNSASVEVAVVAEADLGVASFGPNPRPTEILIGEETPVTIETTIANDGPSSPMDVAVELTASADAGAGVDPTSRSGTATAVEVGADRTVEDAFTLTCAEPGLHTFDFGVEIVPASTDDTDPNGANNEASVSVTVDCVVPVAINIRPRGFPNAVNLLSEATVAVLTTEAGEYDLPLAFDATAINPRSVRFGPPDAVFGVSGGGAPEVHRRNHVLDSYELDERTRDRDADVVLHFAVSASGLEVGDSQACVKGTFSSGTDTFTFFGCDSVIVRP